MRVTTAGWQAGEPRDLGGGLSLRWSCAEDTEALAQLVGQVFRDHDEAPLNEAMSNWVYELMSGEHPAMGSGDFVLVEDTRSGEPEVVAATCYWHHVWEYEGIPLRVGRPELVATAPAYRHRGLMRALFQELHARSEAEGDLLQAITGIPYFYRQFGYEYALNLDGGRVILLSSIPEGDLPAPSLLRDATEEDIPLLQALYEQSRQGQMVAAHIGEDWWRYQVTHWQASRSGEHWHIRLIIDQEQRPWGYLVTPVIRSRQHLVVGSIATAPGANLLAMLPLLLRSLREEGQRMPASAGVGGLTGIAFHLDQQHPICQVLDETLAPQRERPYAWYVRVPDLPRFVQKIAPALEKRLAGSPLVGYTGELRLDLYREGLRLVFEQGRLISVQDLPHPGGSRGEDVRFPPLTFRQLLFGYRSLEELSHAFPDVLVKQEAGLVLKTLFPSRPSRVIPLG